MALLWMTPLLLWLVIAFVADPSDYLALMRSGFLLLGLGLGIGWGLLRNSPRLVFFGLGLALLGYLMFARASGVFLATSGQGFSLYDSTQWEVRNGLNHNVILGFPFAHVVALALVVANIVMVQKRFHVGRIVVSNLLGFAAIYTAAAVLGAH